MTVGTNPIDPAPGFGDPIPNEQKVQRSWVKLLILALVVGALLTVVYFSPLRRYLSEGKELGERVRSFGPLAPLVLAGTVAVLVAIGFPRLILCIVSGMALGFWSGLFWAQIGTLLGNFATFSVVRRFGREWADHWVRPRLGMLRAFEERGATGVFLARQLPLPGLLVNLGCALLPIRAGDFLLGTILGQLPQAIPCTLIGAGVLQASFKKSIGLIGLAVVVAFAAWFGVRCAFRRSGGPQFGHGDSK